MADFWQRLKAWARDPLWLLWTCALLASALTSQLNLFGVIRLSEHVFSLSHDIFQLFFWLPLILCAVRGRTLGSRNQMTPEARFGYVALGTIMFVFTLETLATTIASALAA